MKPTNEVTFHKCKNLLGILLSKYTFVSFQLSKEAYEASKKCIERIKTLLGILPPITVNNDADVEKGEDVINNSENSDINSPSPMIKTIAENTNVFTF